MFSAWIFVAGAVLLTIVFLLRGKTFFQSISHPYIPIQLFVALLFYLSTKSDKLNFIQPAIFLVIAPINFMDSHDSFFGLGFFVMAILLLFKTGFFDKHRIPKLTSLLIYLYGWELFAAFRSGRYMALSLTPVFFVTAFLVYLYILYREQIIVYLKEPKPLLDLKTKGLSAAEIAYILDLERSMTQKEIASKHEVSDSTVRNTLVRAYKKLGVKDKSELSSLLANHTVKPDRQEDAEPDAPLSAD